MYRAALMDVTILAQAICWHRRYRVTEFRCHSEETVSLRLLGFAVTKYTLLNQTVLDRVVINTLGHIWWTRWG